MWQIGIDIGSTFTKYCVMGEQERIQALWSERTPVRQKEHFTEKIQQLHKEYGNIPVVTCGYGRNNAAGSKTITELTALAAGAACQCPECPMILDIGGQDTKLIRQENGRLKSFFLNEKCAAGCGMFLLNSLHLLQMDLADINLADKSVQKIELASVCAVFAQTEIVRLIADGTPEASIIQAVVEHILVQAKALLRKAGCVEIVLSGGLSQIKGIEPFAEKILGLPVRMPEHGGYLSAIGCALQAEH